MRFRSLSLIVTFLLALTMVPVRSSFADGGSGSESEVKGEIDSLPSGGLIGDWRVSGRTVHVSPSTEIDQEHGVASVGAFVEVKGAARTDGSIDAREIEVKSGASGGHGETEDEGEVKGTIESLPNTPALIGDWKIAGRLVHVTAQTRIDQESGRAEVGASAEAKGTSRADGSLDAARIEVQGGGEAGEGEMKFKGTIESLPGTRDFVGDWVVGGRTVHVTLSTKIEEDEGPLAIGAFVEIEGQTRSDGSLDAGKIEVKSNVAGGDGRDELRGRIDALPGTTDLIGEWTVSGRTVRVTASTVIDQEHGRAAIGAQVEVKGSARPDGSLDASKIEVKEASDGSAVEGSRVNLKGTVESVPPSGPIGDWMISGRLVHVVSSTRIKQEHGLAGVGARVKVKGVQMGDGSVVASRIQVRD